MSLYCFFCFFFFQAEDGIRDGRVTGVQTCALPIWNDARMFELCDRPRLIEHMRDEARTIAKLEHPGIVPLHDVGLLPDGRLWYAMKLVRGRRLDELNAPAADLLRVVLRICEAVSFAHANGIVHCDLKPENVMLGDFGEVLVMDWGVARATGARDAIIAGTRGFMSPEQEQGAVVDTSTDIFALGA